MSTEFECCVFTSEAHPNEVAGWPDGPRKLTDAAIARLLEHYPNVKVIDDKGECLDWTHKRFPEPNEHMKRNNLKFALLRSIKVDGDIGA